MPSDLPRQIRAWQERLSHASCASREEALQLLVLLEKALTAAIENAELTDCLDDLEARLLKIENSRSIRLIRWSGQVLLNCRGRLGQLLLHSPLHPVYLAFRRPATLNRPYQAWVEREQNATPPREWFLEQNRRFQKRPVCSILMPVHDPRREWLETALQAVRCQYYPHWELCICDDASAEPWVAGHLEKACSADPRIRFARAPARLGISGALNRAAEIATGDYLTFLDHDDVLPPYALHYVAAALQHTDADLIYSDEDRLDRTGRRVEPIFKPAWSPDLLLSCMYLGHLMVVKRSRFQEIGAFRSEMDGSQDHDLALRLSDRPVVVRHIPRVLYHWRKHAGSTASSPSAKPYAQAAGRRALLDTLQRRGIDAEVEDGPRPSVYRVRRSFAGAGKASLVVCSRREDLSVRCLRAIRQFTDYREYEIVLVQHGVKMRLDGLGCKALYYEGDFNFSHMNNLGAEAADGDWLVFLNDDVIPLSREWLTELARHVARPEVGVVGAQLLYPSGTIQHAGIVTGIMGGAGHAHRHTFGSRYWHWFGLTRNVFAVTGACMALRKRVFEELGGFDEAFPVNFNDLDLCWRARRLGLEVIYEPSAILRHAESQTRTPGVRWRELRHWRAKWPDLTISEDPFYSPHLTIDREDVSLRWDEPFVPEDNCR